MKFSLQEKKKTVAGLERLVKTHKIRFIPVLALGIWKIGIESNQSTLFLVVNL